MSQFYKQPLPKNFDYIADATFDSEQGVFLDKNYTVKASQIADSVLRLTLNYADDRLPQYSIFRNGLPESKNAKNATDNTVEYSLGEMTAVLNLNPFSLRIKKNDSLILESRDVFAGVNGEHTIFQFKKDDDEQPFWGFGSKTGDLNHKNRMMRMWSNDVLGEHPHSWERTDYDPTYVSIPFFITYANGVYVGFFLDNPEETFFNTGKQAVLTSAVYDEEGNDERKPRFYFGSYSGESSLYIFTGDTIGEVVKQYAKLTGVHEMPPIWSLGKHQCRYSYMTSDEVRSVVTQYKEHKLPLDVIWMDIDYMDKYRLFTWDPKRFGDHVELLDWIHTQEVNAVTIVDPGVKEEVGYHVYDDGHSKDVFCKTHNGKEYISQVWPGDTVMPDFSMQKTKDWWAGYIKDFANEGIDGIWLDMNDPSTGPSERNDMLFQDGAVPHRSFHNQYATLMSESTKIGLEQASSEKRSFILTRSAHAEIQKYAAVWTGDNVSSWAHLQMSIPQSVNLSLSGVSFNGPDVGGFMNNCPEDLLIRWYQAGFFFPFFRNHNAPERDGATPHQEPYAFSKTALDSIRTTINTRYKFLPYLYNTFHEHYTTGSSVMRPLFYEFHNPEYFSVSDQFMTGQAIMQAPILTEENTRSVMLPEGKWYEWFSKQWLDGGKTIDVELPLESTTMYLRDGYVIPVLAGDAFHEKSSRDFKNVEFLALLGDASEVTYTYYEDDGATQAYKNGVYNTIEITVKQNGDVTARGTHHGYPSGIDTVRVQVITASGVEEVSCPVSYDM